MSSMLGMDATGETILLVEDNQSARMAMEALLDAMGYHVLSAGDAVEAEKIFAAEENGVELLLTDLLLPHVNGTDLYLRLKQHNPELRCVLMSGHQLDDESERLHGTGIHHWIQKPFSINQLKTLLDSALGK